MLLNPYSPSAAPNPLASPSSKEIIDVDVAIAGGGIVGLTLACALQQSGLRIALIEARPFEAGLQQRRAYAITLMSERIFSGLGVWDDILPHITTFRQIRLADEFHPMVVNLNPEDLGTSALGHVAEHPVLLKALLKKLETAKTVQWFYPTELVAAEYDTTGVTLTLRNGEDDFVMRSRVLVAADGARSPIRQQAGIGTHGWQYWQSCVTAVIRPEQPHGNIAREHFWMSGPFATLPLPGNRAQIVLTAPHTDAKALLEMPETEFLAELNRRYEGRLGQLELVGDRALFPVQLMQSDRYTQSRLALVGDAAHCCHPVGGQGMNLGIRDAASLAQVLMTAHQRGQDIGSIKVLRRYERWRKLENWAILGFTDLLDRCFSNRWWPLVTARRLGLRLMQMLPPVRFLALKLMTGLNGRVPALAAPLKGQKPDLF